MTVDDVIARWRASGAPERGNYQLFPSELCDDLDVPHPDPAGPNTRLNEYVLERRVDYPAEAERDHGFMDLYRRGCFVLEAKQGSDAPAETEAERLGVRETARKQGTARRDRRTWERAMKKVKTTATPASRPSAPLPVSAVSDCQARSDPCRRTAHHRTGRLARPARPDRTSVREEVVLDCALIERQ